MEHQSALNHAKLLTQMLFCILSLFLFTACKQPIENPETLDAIYIDFGNEVKAAQSSIASEEKALKEAQTKLKAAVPRDPMRGPLTREIYKHEKTIVALKQNETYFKIRQEQRKEYDQKAYKDAFDADKTWPDPEEISEYKARKRLQLASRNWEDRVPKSTRYQKKTAASGDEKGKKEAPAEAPKH